MRAMVDVGRSLPELMERVNKHLAKELEVQQQPGGVQFPAPQRQTNLVVVAMGVLTLAAVVAQIMPRGEA